MLGKGCIDELVKEEIRLGTENKKNDFKVVVKQFAEHIETVIQDIDNLIKSC